MKFISAILFFSLLICNTKAFSDIQVSENFDQTYFVQGGSSDISGALEMGSIQGMQHFNLAIDSTIGRIQWIGTQIPDQTGISPIFQISFHHNIDDPYFNDKGKKPEISALASYLVEPNHSFLERGQSNFIGHLNEPLELSKGSYWISISLYAPNINDTSYIWRWSDNRGVGTAAIFNPDSQQLTSSSSNPVFILWGDQPNSPFLDSDNDGVNNNLDLCPNTVDINEVDEDGCSDAQKDTDEDGVSDDIDECPNTNARQSNGFNNVSSAGCTIRQVTSNTLEVIYGSGNSPLSRGGSISDISGVSPVKVFEHIRVRNKGEVNRVVWRGMSMPAEYVDAFPVFKISFHRAQRDRSFPYNHKPIIEPFVSYTLEGEIFATGKGSDLNQTIFFADLPESVVLENGTDYWFSISLVAPNLNNSGVQWYWGRANGLLYASKLDVSTGQISSISKMQVFTLYGKDLEQ